MSKSFLGIILILVTSALGAYVITTVRLNSDKDSVTTSAGIYSHNSATTNTETGVYSLEEVATHNSEGDCWMVIDDKVYDITSFVSKHPGGDEILRGCGLDATGMFESEREHSSSKTDLELTKIQIGILE